MTVGFRRIKDEYIGVTDIGLKSARVFGVEILGIGVMIVVSHWRGRQTIRREVL